MEKDFHLYGTYYAARTAGFDHDASELIANAAQFVDDCKETVVYSSAGGGKIKHNKISINLPTGKKYDFYPFLCGMEGPGWMALRKNDFHRQTWPIFHFLPGNYSIGRAPSIPGHTPRAFEGQNYASCSPAVHREMDKTFPLMCRPNSELVKGMINETVEFYHKYGNSTDDSMRDLLLLLVGLRMHVLADSFAHQDHVGTPDKKINGLKREDLTFTPYGRWDVVEWIPDFTREVPIRWENSASPTTCAAHAPGGRNVLGIIGAGREWTANLGHGRLGHLPDYSWMTYKYYPGWSNGQETRNNPSQYMRAFLTMVHAMECIQNNSTFVPFDDAGLIRAGRNHRATISEIQNLLTASPEAAGRYAANLKGITYTEDAAARCEKWSLEINQRLGNVFVNYNGEHWGNWAVEHSGATVNLEDIRRQKFFLFNCAAKKHFQFVVNCFTGFHGFKLFQLDTIKKEYDPHFGMLDEILGLLGASADGSALEVWREKTAKCFEKCMTAATTPKQMQGLGFLKDAVLGAGNPVLALQNLLATIKNEKRDQTMFRLFTNPRIKQKLTELKKMLYGFTIGYDAGFRAGQRDGYTAGYTTAQLEKMLDDFEDYFTL